MLKIIKLLVVFVVCVSMTFAVAKDNASAMNTINTMNKSTEKNDGSLVKKLQSILKNTRNFHAQYQQVISDPSGKELRNVEGELYVNTPDQFRQTSRPPFQELIVCDGKKIWIYDEDLEQVTVKTMDEKLQQNTPLLLLTNDSDNFSELYEVSGNDMDNDAWLFELRPKNKERLFEKLHVIFKQKILTEMYIIDSLGQKTHLSFSDVKLNKVLDKTLFSFVPPEGVDVVEEN